MDPDYELSEMYKSRTRKGPFSWCYRWCTCIIDQELSISPRDREAGHAGTKVMLKDASVNCTETDIHGELRTSSPVSSSYRLSPLNPPDETAKDDNHVIVEGVQTSPHSTGSSTRTASGEKDYHGIRSSEQQGQEIQVITNAMNATEVCQVFQENANSLKLILPPDTSVIEIQYASDTTSGESDAEVDDDRRSAKTSSGERNVGESESSPNMRNDISAPDEDQEYQGNTAENTLAILPDCGDAKTQCDELQFSAGGDCISFNQSCPSAKQMQTSNTYHVYHAITATKVSMKPTKETVTRPPKLVPHHQACTLRRPFLKEYIETLRKSERLRAYTDRPPLKLGHANAMASGERNPFAATVIDAADSKTCRSRIANEQYPTVYETEDTYRASKSRKARSSRSRKTAGTSKNQERSQKLAHTPPRRDTEVKPRGKPHDTSSVQENVTVLETSCPDPVYPLAYPQTHGNQLSTAQTEIQPRLRHLQGVPEYASCYETEPMHQEQTAAVTTSTAYHPSRECTGMFPQHLPSRSGTQEESSCLPPCHRTAIRGIRCEHCDPGIAEKKSDSSPQIEHDTSLQRTTTSPSPPRWEPHTKRHDQNPYDVDFSSRRVISIADSIRLGQILHGEHCDSKFHDLLDPPERDNSVTSSTDHVIDSHLGTGPDGQRECRTALHQHFPESPRMVLNGELSTEGRPGIQNNDDNVHKFPCQMNILRYSSGQRAEPERVLSIPGNIRSEYEDIAGQKAQATEEEEVTRSVRYWFEVLVSTDNVCDKSTSTTDLSGTFLALKIPEDGSGESLSGRQGITSDEKQRVEDILKSVKHRLHRPSSPIAVFTIQVDDDNNDRGPRVESSTDDRYNVDTPSLATRLNENELEKLSVICLEDFNSLQIREIPESVCCLCKCHLFQMMAIPQGYTVRKCSRATSPHDDHQNIVETQKARQVGKIKQNSFSQSSRAVTADDLMEEDIQTENFSASSPRRFVDEDSIGSPGSSVRSDSGGTMTDTTSSEQKRNYWT